MLDDLILIGFLIVVELGLLIALVFVIAANLARRPVVIRIEPRPEDEDHGTDDDDLQPTGVPVPTQPTPPTIPIRLSSNQGSLRPEKLRALELAGKL
jgi:hypothetical protein